MVETSMVRPPGRLTVRCRGLMADVSGPGSVSVFDRLIDHGPEVVDKMRRIRGGHSDLVSRIPVSCLSGSAYAEVPLPPSQPNWPMEA